MVQRFSGPIGAFSYLLFVLLYTPCVSTIAAIRRELNDAWMWFSIAWSLLVAYGTSLVFYQLATLFEHPVSSLFNIFILFVLMSAVVVSMYFYRHSLRPVELKGA